MILNIPIEPIEERYSKQWDQWFKEQLNESEFEFATIYGDSTSGKINQGAFLDIVETNQYKLSQLKPLINIVSRWFDSDEPLILFFHDLWFPGLETIAYVRDGLGIKNLRICGCLHAGSYDPYDFLSQRGMSGWAQKMEEGWFDGIVDRIFVATQFHKDLLTSTRQITNPERIQVTGFPIYPNFVNPRSSKENIVVFPHRLDPEKQPHLFDQLAAELDNSNWEFIKTKDVCHTKAEYYELLNKSKIALSFALQETWGIAMQEAVLCGNTPICSNRLSYPELFNPDFVYNDYSEAVELTKYYMEYTSANQWIQRNMIELWGATAIPNIIRQIRSMYED